MKHFAQVIYNDFVELFECGLEENQLKVKLVSITEHPDTSLDSYILNLSTNIKENYSIFPYEPGDLCVIQSQNTFVISLFQHSDPLWIKITANDLYSFVIKSEILDTLMPYFNEDKSLLLNGVFSDLLRSDYSFSEINKKIKFVKISILFAFLKQYLENREFHRIILDETVLGDIEIESIPLAFRHTGFGFHGLVKIHNITKLLVLLNKEGVLENEVKFVEDAFFLNNTNHDKISLIFGESGMKFDYQIQPFKNYVFDIGENTLNMNVSNRFQEFVRGKVFVYNGDERDFMLG